MQIPGPNGRGITTVEMMEDSTWTPLTTAPAKPTTDVSESALLAYVTKLRDRRKEN